MNREIKFRAWFIPELRMHKVNAISFNDEWIDTNKYNGSINDFILMQFTGLLDKNGKEIYEGDIVNIANQSVRLMEYIDGGFGYYSELEKNTFIGFSGRYKFEYIIKSTEVIGNIYDNPELLT